MNDGHTSAIPAWLQIAWAVAGLCVAVGGAVWILFIFLPYLTWTRRIMRESLELGRSTAKTLETLKQGIAPVVEDLKGLVADARRATGKLGDHDIEHTLRSIQALPRKLDEVIESQKKKFLEDL